MKLTGRLDRLNLMQMLDEPSAFGNEPREGIYLRYEQNGRFIARAKLVRPEFIQQIGDHWAKSSIQPNRLAALTQRASS